MKSSFLPDEFELGNALDRLTSFGAAAVRVLDEGFRLLLLEEAKRYTFRTQPAVVASGDRIVRQQMQVFAAFSKTSRYVLLKNRWQARLNRCLAALAADPFPVRLHFNSMVLQKYEPGSIGITPHRDRSVYLNLISLRHRRPRQILRLF